MCYRKVSLYILRINFQEPGRVSIILKIMSPLASVPLPFLQAHTSRWMSSLVLCLWEKFLTKTMGYILTSCLSSWIFNYSFLVVTLIICISVKSTAFYDSVKIKSLTMGCGCTIPEIGRLESLLTGKLHNYHGVIDLLAHGICFFAMIFFKWRKEVFMVKYLTHTFLAAPADFTGNPSSYV